MLYRAGDLGNGRQYKDTYFAHTVESDTIYIIVQLAMLPSRRSDGLTHGSHLEGTVAPSCVPLVTL